LWMAAALLDFATLRLAGLRGSWDGLLSWAA